MSVIPDLDVNINTSTDLKYLEEYLQSVPENTKIYIGCDSERVKRKGQWHADYCTVVVVHKGGNNGCKIFGEIVRERDFDGKLDKPAMRLMNEVYKVAEFYLNNFDLLDPFDPEIHLDINPDLEYGSSCVITQAIGYIKGTCGIEPLVKPEAFSASYAADRFAYIQRDMSKKRRRRMKRKENKKYKKELKKK